MNRQFSNVHTIQRASTADPPRDATAFRPPPIEAGQPWRGEIVDDPREQVKFYTDRKLPVPPFILAQYRLYLQQMERGVHRQIADHRLAVAEAASAQVVDDDEESEDDITVTCIKCPNCKINVVISTTIVAVETEETLNGRQFPAQGDEGGHYEENLETPRVEPQ